MKKTIYFILFIIILVFLSEIILRIIYLNREYLLSPKFINFTPAEIKDYEAIVCKVYGANDDSKIVIALAPYALFRYKKLNLKIFKTNSDGFREREFEPKEFGEIRGLILGGSAAIGIGSSSNEKTLGRFLENIIEIKKNQKVTVYNLAVGSYISNQELIVLITVGLDLQPDFVVVFDGYNDFTRHFNYPERAIGIPDSLDQFETYLNAAKGYGGQFLRLKLTELLSFIQNNNFVYKKLYFHMYRFKKRMEGRNIIKKEAKIDNAILTKDRFAVDAYMRNLRIMNEICKLYGIKFLVILQPFIDTKNQAIGFERHFTNSNWTQRLLRSYEYVKENIGDLRKNGVMIYDFSDIFDNLKKPVYVDRVHFSEEATKLIAYKIYDLLEQHYLNNK